MRFDQAVPQQSWWGDTPGFEFVAVRHAFFTLNDHHPHARKANLKCRNWDDPCISEAYRDLIIAGGDPSGRLFNTHAIRTQGIFVNNVVLYCFRNRLGFAVKWFHHTIQLYWFQKTTNNFFAMHNAFDAGPVNLWSQLLPGKDTNRCRRKL